MGEILAGFHELPIGLVRESGLNPRTEFDPVALEELRASIATHGVMEPLRVRQVNSDFEVISGARRLRAARAAGLATVPAIVVLAARDEVAREAAIVANLQRADIAPLDEARAFGALVGDRGRTLPVVQSIAERVGKAPGYVWDRLKLLDLVPAAQQLLAAGRITVAHGIVLARLAKSDQKRAIDEGLFQHEEVLELLAGGPADRGPFAGHKARSVRELEAWIARSVRFDVFAAATAAPLEFGATLERVNGAIEAGGRGKRVVKITHDHFVQPSAKLDGERTYTERSWKRADGRDKKSPTCDRSVLGIVVVGPDYGQSFEVCVNKDCSVHWAAEQKARAKASAGGRARDQAARREESERKQRADQAREERQRKVWATAAPALREATAAALKRAKVGGLVATLIGQIWDKRRAVIGTARRSLPTTRCAGWCLRGISRSSKTPIGPRETSRKSRRGSA